MPNYIHDVMQYPEGTFNVYGQEVDENGERIPESAFNIAEARNADSADIIAKALTLAAHATPSEMRRIMLRAGYEPEKRD